MKNLNAILKQKGIQKRWFIENVLSMKVTTFYGNVKANSLPQHAIEAAIKHLGVTFEELTK